MFNQLYPNGKPLACHVCMPIHVTKSFIRTNEQAKNPIIQMNIVHTRMKKKIWKCKSLGAHIAGHVGFLMIYIQFGNCRGIHFFPLADEQPIKGIASINFVERVHLGNHQIVWYIREFAIWMRLNYGVCYRSEERKKIEW